VANRISKSDVPPEFLDAAFIIIGPILGEVDLELIEFIRSSSSAKLFLDPQGLLRIIGNDRRIVHTCNREAFAKIAKLVDFIKPNEHESVTITGRKDPLQTISKLRDMSPAVPIVTLAERGSMLIDGSQLYHIPAFTTNALDPTGAGDVYAGSFIAEYSRSKDIVGAALFASAAASIMVEQIGPGFVISLEAVEERRALIRERLKRQHFGQI
jgi:sugar/nucleoside kinase (ribokinase family)